MAAASCRAHLRHDKLLALVPTFSAIAVRQADRWRAAPRERPVDVAEAMAQTTCEVIVDTMLGSAGALDVRGFARALTTELDSFPWRFILTSFRAPSWLPYPGRRSAARAREHIYREAARLVAQRRQGSAARGDLLDLLLQARDEETGRVMTDEELVRNLATFMLAGHETTAVALTWTLWLLAKYPHVQDQVAAEAQATIGSGAVAAQQVERLTFARQVLQEAMRLYPPAPAISRQPLAPLVLAGEQLTRPRRLPSRSIHFIAIATSGNIPIASILIASLWTRPRRARGVPTYRSARDRASASARASR